MNCDVCPVPGNPRCVGIRHRPACAEIRSGNTVRADDLRRLATDGYLCDADRSALFLRADLCRWADPASPCGCGVAPRLCTRPDRVGAVWRNDCLACAARPDWTNGPDQ